MKNNTKNNVCYIRKTTETEVMNPKWCSFFLSFCRFIPSGNGNGLRQARVQTLEPNQWMKEVLTFFLSS